MFTLLSKFLHYKPKNNFLLSILTCCVALPPATVLTVYHGIGISGIILTAVCLLFLLSKQGEHRPLQPSDRWLLLALCTYPAIIFIGILLPNSEFRFALIDYPLRFIFVIPVFLALRRVNLPAHCLYAGIIFGAIGAGFFAIYQKFILGFMPTYGFVFHISFGDISILLGFMSISAWPIIKNTRYKKTGLFMVLTAFTLGITGSILSTARGGWIAAPILFLILINSYISSALIRIGISVIFVSAGFGLYAGNDYIHNRVDLATSEIKAYYDNNSGEDLTDNSVGARLEMWKASWMMFKENPWTGIGTGNFYEVSGKLIKAGKMQAGAHYDHAHSDYISLLAESGIPGFISLLLLYGIGWYYFSSGIKQQNSIQNNTLAITGQLLIAGYATFSLTQTNLNHQVTIFFLALMIATLAGMMNRKSG
jgi:O-antigen ligase